MLVDADSTVAARSRNDFSTGPFAAERPYIYIDTYCPQKCR